MPPAAIAAGGIGAGVRARDDFMAALGQHRREGFNQQQLPIADQKPQLALAIAIGMAIGITSNRVRPCCYFICGEIRFFPTRWLRSVVLAAFRRCG